MTYIDQLTLLGTILGRTPTLRDFLDFDFEEYNRTSNSRKENI